MTRKLILVAAVVAMLAAIAAWWGIPGERVDTPSPAGAALAALPGASASGTQAFRIAAASPPHVAGSAIAGAADARAELARKMKDDWCGFGVAARDRLIAAPSDKAKTEGDGQAAVAELGETVVVEVMAEAREEVLRRWVQALNQRGDQRSLAVADYLQVGDGALPGGSARLQARARTSSDPMVTALALQRPCAAGVCTNIEASQWSRLEPANLQAWLALAQDPTGKLRQTHGSYVLDRMAQEVHYSRRYEQEFKALLLSLPQTETPGLQNEAEIQLIYGSAAAWTMPSMRPVTETCRNGLADAGTASRCDVVAQLFWQQDDLLGRAIGLNIARSLVAAQPWRRQKWEPRARVYEAADEWQRMEIERAAGQLQKTAPCGGQADMRKELQESAIHGEWNRSRAGMDKSEFSEAVLSERWRKQRGRSSLDPVPTGQPSRVN